MAADQEQQERRGDTVALPRSTFKAGAWILAACLSGISLFIWDRGDKIDALITEQEVLEFRVKHLEDFGPGKRLERQIDQVRQQCERHRELGAHREQAQLNREFKWRLKNLEKPNSDGPIHFKLGPNE